MTAFLVLSQWWGEVCPVEPFEEIVPCEPETVPLTVCLSLSLVAAEVDEERAEDSAEE
ncbi:hypothetical protein LX15_000221 [Streptoalloteichus tenebrarius]|uniref:Uncharacterized protein n=1 Tax=Streptoalloteichus tenebrarius (strain ATCC 17920 / DSM 40477 / JCM 4838 / CBS 697.72 / NBRC 16177 / NCIMB 11028 / NRRL B-12390 / A12253. 1 / ISP 5477) TaxID=1933 RepID=A0ABT1HM00_STRSD|nr:hypothetical protein [Streptoalloteichus tenebrarius]